MKKRFLKIICFFRKESVTVFLTKLGILLALIGVLLLLAIEVWREILMTAFGVMLSSVAIYMFKILLGYFEDMLKINFDTEALLKIYNKEIGDNINGYEKNINLSKGTSKKIVYDDVLVLKDNEQTFNVIDNPEKIFKLDTFIMENYGKIFAAHSGSDKANYDTVRLDDFDPKTNTFHLSRSTYFNHLVTNRAVDYELFEGVTLRQVYEFGPRLNDLSMSKMSNHVGINGLVFLSDGRLLVPHRDDNSTISKNKITSSIATMLTFPNEDKNDPKNATISKEYLFYDNIIENLTDRTKLPEIDVKNAEENGQIDVRFLGFGRNIYEGGKPQMYYAVKLNNIDTKKYFELRDKYMKSNKNNSLDVDKCMYAADLSSFAFKGDGITFNTYTPCGKKERKRKVFLGYEMSHLCNLWHYHEAGQPFGKSL